jgi:DNA-binding NtrC family response regulator
MRVLIVDDQASARRVLSAIVRKLDDVEIDEADGLAAARQAIETQAPDIALIDLRLGPDARNRDGLTLVEEIRARTTIVPIIVTAYQEVAEIRQAMRVGAYDYILKDDLCDELVLPVLTALRARRRLEHEVSELRARQPATEPVTGRLVGVSPAMELLRETIRRAALSDRPVLVTGPTGSGKELVVEALHTLGPHPDHPLLDVNCGAIPEALMESQLFGHAKGAFTGAEREQQGYLAQVKQGTLFLDEVAELPAALQSKLLRILETGVFRPVGSTAQGRFEGRVVAATHADLAERVRNGSFREDLFYRLNVLAVRVPPLGERREDIPALVAHFCRGQKRPLRFSEAALDILVGAAWPGHIRQLRNLVDRVAAFADDDLITPDALGPFISESPASNTNADALQNIAQKILRLPIENKLEAVEEALVAEAVRLSDGNKSGAARLLGMHRKAISRRL